MAKIVETNPDRFMYQPNVSPIKHGRCDQNAIRELVYWVKEKGAKIFKFYSPEDTYMNDPELWPFYEKAQELASSLIFTPVSVGYRPARASMSSGAA